MYVIGMIYGHALCNPLEREIIYCVGGQLITILVKSNFIGVVTRQLMAKKDISPLYSRSQKNNVFLWHRKKDLTSFISFSWCNNSTFKIGLRLCKIGIELSENSAGFFSYFMIEYHIDLEIFLVHLNVFNFILLLFYTIFFFTK